MVHDGEDRSTAGHPTLQGPEDESPDRTTSQGHPPRLLHVVAIGSGRDRSLFEGQEVRSRMGRIAWTWINVAEAKQHAWWCRERGRVDAVLIGSEAGRSVIALPAEPALAHGWRVTGLRGPAMWVFSPATTEGALDAVLDGLPLLASKRNPRLQGVSGAAPVAVLPFDQKAMEPFAASCLPLLLRRESEVLLVPPCAPESDVGRAWLEAMLAALTSRRAASVPSHRLRAVAPDRALVAITGPHPPEYVVAASWIAPVLAAAAGLAVPMSLGGRWPLARLADYPDARADAWIEGAEALLALEAP